MTQIDAIYQDGVFKPLDPVLSKRTNEFRITIELVRKQDVIALDGRRQQAFVINLLRNMAYYPIVRSILRTIGAR